MIGNHSRSDCCKRVRFQVFEVRRYGDALQKLAAAKKRPGPLEIERPPLFVIGQAKFVECNVIANRIG
jgi:hypothetical protein